MGAACLGPRPARLHRVTDHLSNRTPAPPQAAARAAIASALAAQTTEAASLGPRTLAQLHATAAALQVRPAWRAFPRPFFTSRYGSNKASSTTNALVEEGLSAIRLLVEYDSPTQSLVENAYVFSRVLERTRS